MGAETRDQAHDAPSDVLLAVVTIVSVVWSACLVTCCSRGAWRNAALDSPVIKLMIMIMVIMANNHFCNSLYTAYVEYKAHKESSLFLELCYIRDDLAQGPGVDFLR